jgi:hypothetical protein
MTPTDLAWLAGLIEGEGCFTRHTTRGRWHSANIKVQMSDEDVIRRCLSVSNLGRVHGPYVRDNPKWSPQWIWAVTRRDEGIELMTLLYPLMGDRRQSQIRECLKIYQTVPSHETYYPQEYDSFAWLAGLIEGEGHMRSDIKASQYDFITKIIMKVVMVDEDIIQRCLAISGVGRVWGPISPKDPKNKPTWAWQVASREDVVALMTKLRPLMGERRQRQIDECLSVHELHPPRLSNQHQIDKTHCPQGHPYDDENTLVHRGHRSCRACMKIAGKRHREKQRLLRQTHDRQENIDCL